MAKYVVISHKGAFFDKNFPSLNLAQDYAANHFAVSVGLPKGQYYLQWDITLRDREYTRVYGSKEGLYSIVAEEI